MDYIVVEGVAPYDGRYEFDLRGSSFSVREWGWVKRHTGYLPLTLDEGLVGSDAELFAIFAIIALVRAGKVAREDVPDVWERFADAPGVVTVRLELNRSEGDEVESDPTERPSENGASSGAALNPSSGRSVSLPPVTGTPDSATSESRPVRTWQS